MPGAMTLGASLVDSFGGVLVRTTERPLPSPSIHSPRAGHGAGEDTLKSPRKERTRGADALQDRTEYRWLPAGDPRSLPRLDAEVAGRTAAGEKVQVVYSARGDKFMIVPQS